MFKHFDNILRKAFKVDYVIHARVLIILFIIITILPIILTQSPISLVDFSETGQIGDTIGGITAPFIGIIAGYLTFLAFHEQYRANEKATKDLEKERFESKFYNFLSLLNNLELNTSIPNVGNYKQAFHFMFYEYKSIVVLLYSKKKGAINKHKDDSSIRKAAFNIFINGVSISSTSRLNEYLDGSENLNDFYLWLQKYYSKPDNPIVPYLDDYNTVNIKLFDGHRLRLISFFRLVCKIIEMIYEDGKEYKELYLSTLMSMLSEHQIALLKIMYVFDKEEHERFLLTNKDKIEHFFMDDFDKNHPNECINKYIYTDIMDCTKSRFIDYKKSEKLGFIVKKKK